MRSEKYQGWSNEKLEIGLGRWAVSERKVTAVVIELVAEAIERKAFIEWGCGSIPEFLIKKLKYSESSANRRVSAAYALIQIPEIKEEIENGSLNLSQIVLAQCAIRAEQKVNGKVEVEAKKEIFDELRNKTCVETQKILDEKFETVPIFSAEKHKHDDSVEVTIRLPKDVHQKFVRLKQLYSHTIRDGSWLELLDTMADETLKRKDPLAKKPVDLKKKRTKKENQARKSQASGPMFSEKPTQGSSAHRRSQQSEASTSSQCATNGVTDCNDMAKGNSGEATIANAGGKLSDTATATATATENKAGCIGGQITFGEFSRRSLPASVRRFVRQRDRFASFKIKMDPCDLLVSLSEV